MARISIDPVTRIEGHLRIDVEVDGGTVNKAWASCTMWRGLETILRGRDAREGWVFSGFAVSALRYMALLLFVRLKTRSHSTYRRTRSTSAI